MKKIFLTLVICFISFFIRGHNLDATVRLETQTQIESVQKEIPQSTLVPHVIYTKAYLFQIGVYFGFIAMLLIVNILFYLSTKDNSFIFYVLLITVTNLTIAYHEGLLYPYVKNTFFQYDIDMLLHIANVFVGFKFFTVFLDIKKFYPKLLMYIKVYLGLYLLIMLSYFITDNYQSIRIANIIGFTFLLLLWVFSFFFIKKVFYAKYISIAFGVFIIAVFINMVFGNLKLPFFGNIAYIVRLGAIIEAIVLTYAATYRLRVLKEENLAMENAIKKHITRVLHLEKSLHIVNKKETTKQSFTVKLLELAKNHALTDREIDVLECLTQGLSYEKIAIALFVSKNTIKYHTRNIYEKLGVKTSIEITSKLTV